MIPRLAIDQAVPDEGSSRVRSGIIYALGAALISGVAIYVNAFAVKQLPDAGVYTTLKNGFAAVVLMALVVGLGGVQDVLRIPRGRWPVVLAVGVVGGSIPFILFFTGLAQASAPSAAFVQKTLFVWVALLAVPFLGERLGWPSLAALTILLLGQLLVLPPTGIRWGSGETLILAATLLWAVETVLVKRLLADMPAGLLGAMRLLIGVPVLVAYLGISGKLTVLAGLSATQWTWAILTGGLLAGYVATWFRALERAPAAVVTSVLVLGAVVTAALGSIDRGSLPSPTTVGGLTLIMLGAGLMTAWSLRLALRSREAALVPIGVRE